MRSILTLVITLSFISVFVFSQTVEIFDIVTYKTPKGWRKEVTKDAVQFGIEDSSSGGSCLISMFRSVEANSDSKINFNVFWKNIVGKMVTLKSDLERQQPANENGWTAESGFAKYESDGVKGLVMLVTLTGNSQMVNILVLTNTDAYQQTITDFLDSIILPRIVKTEPPQTNKIIDQAQTAKTSGFKFNETKFDDGWTATEQEDFVRVTKGNTTVLIHYEMPDIRPFNNLDESTVVVWNKLVAPRYSNISNFWARRSWYGDGDFMNKQYYAEAELIDSATKQKVFVALFKSGNAGRWLEFITPNKTSFQKEYSNIYEQDGTNWEKLARMATYNKFAVAASDLNGNWKSSSAAGIELYNVYSGNSVGMATSSSTNDFTFLANGNYSNVYKGVSGAGAGLNYYGETSKGKFSVSNWEVKLTNRFKGATHTFSAQFESVKGGRILQLKRGEIEEINLLKVR